MGIKIENDIVVRRLENIFPNYKFDLSEYTNTHCKIPTVCDNGHKSIQVVKNLFKGHGCRICSTVMIRY